MLIRSISTIALVTTIPISISIPIRPGNPSGVSVSSSSPIEPVAANGTDTISTSDCAMLRKVPTSTRNTIAIAASSAKPI